MARLAARVDADIDARQQREADVARERRVAKARALLREVLQEHREAEAAARRQQATTVSTELHNVLDGRRWVDGWETRQAHARETTAVDRLISRWGRPPTDATL
jgi:hypothetical protein